MWHSEADIMNDLAALNDFGEPGNTEPYKILCSIGRGSKTKKKPQIKTIVDPRTGEEIEVDDQCLSVEDMLYKGKGRGAVLGSRCYSLLHKQLRLARPLGSGDEIIESYCRRNNVPKHEDTSPVLSNSQSASEIKENGASFPINSSKTMLRVKAVRNSNMLNNALITSLLKAKERSSLNFEIQKSNKIDESEIFDESSKVCAYNCKNGEIVRSAICQSDSHSDDSFSWHTSEDATSESLCYSSKSSYAEEIYDKIKVMEPESSRSFRVDLNKDCNPNFSYREGDEEVPILLKKQNHIRNPLCSESTDQNLVRNEMYKKLGERINRMKMTCDQRKKNNICFFTKNHEPINGTLHSQNTSDLDPIDNQLAYDELNFPSLVKNNWLN